MREAVLTRVRTKRNPTDVLIASALVAVLLANTVVAGTAGLVLAYLAIALTAAVAIARKRVWLTLLLAAVALGFVVLGSTI